MRLTGSHAEVGPYPYTTKLPLPGMLAFEDVHFQLKRDDDFSSDPFRIHLPTLLIANKSDLDPDPDNVPRSQPRGKGQSP